MLCACCAVSPNRSLPLEQNNIYAVAPLCCEFKRLPPRVSSVGCDRGTDNVEQITGQRAQTVEQYVAANPNLFY